MDVVLHPQQAGGFLFYQARYRHAGPGADDLGDVLLVNLRDGGAELVAPFHLFLDVLSLSFFSLSRKEAAVS